MTTSSRTIRRVRFRTCGRRQQRDMSHGSDAGRSRSTGRDCPRCPRLVAFRETWRARQPDWFNAPVASFGSPDARLLIVGLAPGLQGANRTGRPFTGDYAGDLLYATLLDFGFASRHLSRPPGRRSHAARRPHHQCGALRAAGEQAERPGDRALPRFSARHHCGNAEPRGDRRARPDRPRHHGGGAGPARVEPQVRPWRDPSARRRHAFRQLSLLALQHEHRAC